MLVSYLETRINDTVYQKLPGCSLFLLCPPAPVMKMFMTGNQAHGELGLHCLFFDTFAVREDLSHWNCHTGVCDIL